MSSRFKPYPAELREFVHQKYTIEKLSMTQVIALVKEKFPGEENRITAQHMHSVAWSCKQGIKRSKHKQGKRSKVLQRSGEQVFGDLWNAREPDPKVMFKPTPEAFLQKRAEIIEKGSQMKLRGENWRRIYWKMVKEYADCAFPKIREFNRMLIDRVNPSSSNGRSVKLAATMPNGDVMNIEISSKRFTQFLMAIVGS